MTLNGKKILLGLSGGVAAYKAAELTRLLVKAGADVRIAMTEAATHFIGTATMQALSGQPVWTDRAVQSWRSLAYPSTYSSDATGCRPLCRASASESAPASIAPCAMRS